MSDDWIEGGQLSLNALNLACSAGKVYILYSGEFVGPQMRRKTMKNFALLSIFLALYAVQTAVAQESSAIPRGIYEQLSDELQGSFPDGSPGLQASRRHCVKKGRFQTMIFGWNCSCEAQECYTCRDVIIDGKPAEICENPESSCEAGTGRCEKVITF